MANKKMIEPPEPKEGEVLFLVYGHAQRGKGLIVEVIAKNGAEALEIARKTYPDCRFNHSNIK